MIARALWQAPLAALTLLLFYGCNGQPQSADLALVGGFVVDGTGRSGRVADVVVHDGAILAIGPNALRKFHVSSIVDASGFMVTPGFIDMHAHGDPLQTPDFSNFLAMGVTTICLGQDGSSPPVREMANWFASIDSLGTAVNVVPFAGHGTLRNEAGMSNGKHHKDQTAALIELVDSAMTLGCFGVTTGLEYTPGRFASPRELEAIARQVGELDGMIMSHVRNEDDSVLDRSLDELICQGDHCRVHVAHMKSTYGKGAQRGRDLLNRLAEARAAGVDITADVYPYLASYTGIAIVFPNWAKTKVDFAAARSTREQELRQFLHQKIIQRNGPEAMLFGTPPFRGLTLAEVAEQSGTSYVDVLMQLGPGSVSAAYFIMDSALQYTLIEAPSVMISSDGSPSMHHPRGYGAFARIFRLFVKERKTMTYEEAVHKMTELGATTLGLTNRGTLQVGFRADINIIDTSAVADNASFAEPHQYASGFARVYVNGQLAWSNNASTQALAGALLRRDPN